mmetsp:Transcript_19905/g.27586  ORF Transcript_19905/g.27586 Transcript_19905/m.27586 type:complete len:205 (+) Transcript_19905:1101-1715(+)
MPTYTCASIPRLCRASLSASACSSVIFFRGDPPPMEAYAAALFGALFIDIKYASGFCNHCSEVGSRIISGSANKLYKKGCTSSSVSGPPRFNNKTPILFEVTFSLESEVATSPVEARHIKLFPIDLYLLYNFCFSKTPLQLMVGWIFLERLSSTCLSYDIAAFKQSLLDCFFNTYNLNLILEMRELEVDISRRIPIRVHNPFGT